MANPSEKHSLIILDDYQSLAPSYFTSLSLPNLTITTHPTTLHPLHSAHDHTRLIALLHPHTIISTMRERTPLPSSVLTQLPNLRLLLTTGTRNLGIDTPTTHSMGVVYTGTTNPLSPDDPEANNVRSRYSGTNEHTWALILSLARNIPADDVSTKTNGPAWQSGFAYPLAGKTIGVVGLGRLGAQCAITARLGFGMKVVCWSENLTQERADEVAGGVGLGKGVFRVAKGKEELFKEADVVSLHLVLSERTKGLVGERELGWMKRSALLVNTSRGGLCDEEALLGCLEKGGISGCALDVYEKEPLDAGSRWRTTEWGKGGRSRVVLSPHMGYAEEEVLREWYRQQAENVRRWMEGEEVMNRILPKGKESKV